MLETSASASASLRFKVLTTFVALSASATYWHSMVAGAGGVAAQVPWMFTDIAFATQGARGQRLRMPKPDLAPADEQRVGGQVPLAVSSTSSPQLHSKSLLATTTPIVHALVDVQAPGDFSQLPADLPQVSDGDARLFRESYSKLFSWWHDPPKPSRVRLLIMVTSIAMEFKMRQVHRETWMTIPGVCKVSADTVSEPVGSTPDGCNAFAVFFVGKDNMTDAYVQKELDDFKDLVVLDVLDRWNFSMIPMMKPLPSWDVAKKGPWIPTDHMYKPAFNGEVKAKTLGSFQYAIEHFPWVTHYAKNDIDNYPYVAQLVEDFQDIENSPAGLVPATAAIKPKSNPTPWEEGHGIFYGATMGGFMMQGQFYTLSRPVLECIFHRTDVMRCKGKPGEDAMVGCWVTNTYNVSNSPQWGIPWAHSGPCPEPWRVNQGHGTRWCACKPRQCPISGGGHGPLEASGCAPKHPHG